MQNNLKISIIIVLILILISLTNNTIFSQDPAMHWFNLGAKAKNQNQKINYYSEAIKLNPEFIEAYYNLGYVYKKKNDFMNALNMFQKALSADPSKLDSQQKLRITYELGMTFKKLNRFHDALRSLNEAKYLARSTEIRAVILYELGRVYLVMGQFNRAITEFNEGLQFQNKKTSALNAALEKATELKNIENHYVKGIDYYNDGKHEKSVEELTQVINLDPNYKDASTKLRNSQKYIAQENITIEKGRNYSKGIGYMAVNNWENAITAFQQVVAVDPDYKDVSIKLAEAETKLNMSSVDNSIEQIYSQGLDEFNKGNWSEAATALKRVLEINPNYKQTSRFYRDAKTKLSTKNPVVKESRYTQISNDLIQETQMELEKNSNENLLENYYAEGLNHFENGDWLKAMIFFEKVKQFDLNYKDVSEKIRLAQDNINNVKMANAAIQFEGLDTRKSGSLNWPFVGVIFSVLLIPTAIAIILMPTNRAKLQLLQGNYHKAAQIYEFILLKSPQKIKYYLPLANIYTMQNRNDDTAVKVYKVVQQLSIDPQVKEKINKLTQENMLNKPERNNLEKHV